MFLFTVNLTLITVNRTHPGYNLVCIGCNQFLIDFDGRVVHEWQSERACFCAYLLPNGHLLRDGSDSLFASSFRTGGAAGYVEEVSTHFNVFVRMH